MNVVDKAGRQYWAAAETNLRIHRFDPAQRGIRHHAQRQWDAFLTRWLGDLPARTRLLEIGCGGSALLPYFASRFGFDVSGIDYSESGCRLAEQLCRERGCSAQIVCADACDPPREMFGAFEAVVSFGVVEHFTDAAAAIDAFARFLVTGGRFITTVPNMSGWPGELQQRFAPDIFGHHVALDAPALAQVHRAAGLGPIASGYLQSVNFGVINTGANATLLRRAGFQALRALTVAAWTAEEIGLSLPPNRRTSPYVFCVAQKPTTNSPSNV